MRGRKEGAVPFAVCAQSKPVSAFNYFNYYTEIEEHFWQKRGAHILVSTLDWAVIESWQKAGVPLEIVLKGIDRAFASYQAKPRPRLIKSLLYCVDAVAEVAEEAREAAAGRGPQAPSRQSAAPFEPRDVEEFLRTNAAALHRSAERPGAAGVASSFHEIAAALETLAAQPAAGAAANLEDLERHLTVLEEKLLAALTQAASAEDLLALRREVERGLAPYRRKMKAEQLALIEKQFLQKKLFERHGLPRLSLFYLPAAAPPRESSEPSEER